MTLIDWLPELLAVAVVVAFGCAVWLLGAVAPDEDDSDPRWQP